jgi:hypothetical protein
VGAGAARRELDTTDVSGVRNVGVVEFTDSRAYRYQLGPIRKTIPALDEAFRSVRPEQYRGVREQSWTETPKFTWRR